MAVSQEVPIREHIKEEDAKGRYIDALKKWNRATEAANRHNRNILQLGASIVTILSIEAGSGGLFALAESLSEQGTGIWIKIPLISVFFLGFIALITLTCLLATAYRKRQKAEENAECFFAMVIDSASDPERFLQLPSPTREE